MQARPYGRARRLAPLIGAPVRARSRSASQTSKGAGAPYSDARQAPNERVPPRPAPPRRARGSLRPYACAWRPYRLASRPYRCAPPPRAGRAGTYSPRVRAKGAPVRTRLAPVRARPAPVRRARPYGCATPPSRRLAFARTPPVPVNSRRARTPQTHL